MPQGTDTCNTCYGTGEIATEHGLTSCPDCYGDGKAANTGNKLEWRLRELEKTYRTNNHEGLSDVMWLVHELRQARDALLLILTRCQDADDEDEVARYVRSKAMAALGLYPRTPAPAHASRERS
jgi:hypothetical protein